MRVSTVFLALALAGSAGSREARGQTSALAGAHEATLVLLGDTITPKFSILSSDTTVAKVVGGSVIIRGCGVAHIYLRIYHRSQTNPAVLEAITADSTQLQVLDTTAASGPCAPAAPPTTPCSVDGSLSVDPMALPAECILIRNRFLASPSLDSALFRFIARAYPSPPGG